MTKKERQIILDYYAEYKIAQGFYLEQREQSKSAQDKQDIMRPLSDVAEKAGVIKELLNKLSVKPDIDYIEQGREKYKEAQKNVY